MSKLSKKNYSIVISAAVAASALISGTANAQASQDSQVVRSVTTDSLVRPSAVAQNVTSVSQLSDVRPTDWAFTALQSLVERYGCIAGYPDSTFRGKQATSRYEFAAGLNACLDKINEIISAGLADKVSKEDLATLQKLQEEFAAELATLRGRVDALDAKTAKLEAQQFSTTTKLRGEAIFGLVGGTDGVAPTSQTNVVFNYRARLNFDTSFTGKDLLRTRLQASNTASFNSLATSNSTRLVYDGVSAANTNVFELNRLYYLFPVGESLRVYVAPIGAVHDILDPLNPLSNSSDQYLSRFSRLNPLLRIASGGNPAVAGFDWKLTDKVNFQASYSASNAALATGQGGVAGGDTKIAAQFVFKPAEALKLGVGYARAYTVGNSLGSGLNVDSLGGVTAPGVSGINSDTVVGSLIWDITKKFTFNTWGSYTFANTTGVTTAGTTFTSWLAALSAKDVFTEGDLAALSFGQPLLRTGVSGAAQGSASTPYHLEALYRFRVSKNISITPGVYFVFNQNSDSANGTATVGVIRTTFSF
jgi:hypothetical protein